MDLRAERDLRAEWLEPDGHGGFATGTVGLVRTRRYHALLLADTATGGRFVLVNGIEVWAETGAGRFALSSQRYRPDVIFPDGARRIASFTHLPWPSWEFELPDRTVIRQSIFISRDTQDVVLRWSSDHDLRLVVRPLLSGRDYHSLHVENPGFDFATRRDGEALVWFPYSNVPPITARGDFNWVQDPEWYRGFSYALEQERGMNDGEDLASPGRFEWALTPDRNATLMLRAGAPGNTPADALETQERTRRQRPARDVASDAYLATRSGRPTVLAGFPWFTDWGRDTFIAMRGLLLARGRLQEAAEILLAWSQHVSEGMLPNRFPEGNAAPEYNAADASLWFIVAVHELIEANGASRAVSARLQEASVAILEGYTAGTRFGIGQDARDGLLRAGVPGLQLTWMDAKLGDHVFTPRIGKPVELQALWVNALAIAGRWPGGDRWMAAGLRARESVLAYFPDRETGGLIDVLDADGIPGAMDRQIRPNQVLAAGGLPLPVLTPRLVAGVVDVAERHLLTPLGLRTLAPTDPAYQPYYRGNVAARDAAYHQGTVWPWLLGPFVAAWLARAGNTAEAREAGRARFLPPLYAHLEQFGLGHVAEVADGEAPHQPGGCPFQAWSMGELIRVEAMLGVPEWTADPIFDTAEGRRLRAADRGYDWRRWGPYLSERQWGTVREDYSPGGTAWDYLPHDHARSRAYRWGEDGLAGFADDKLLWCLCLGLWNERDPILKERLFGLTNAQGNHGEDVKELYYFLDGTPTHSYMRMLYKYPQAAFPYDQLIAQNAARSVTDREFELVDTGIFNERRYFDVVVEYAKASADDILMQITAHNRGPDPAPLHILPQLWARNTWSWDKDQPKPSLRLEDGRVIATHPRLGRIRICEVDAPAEWLFCENETNFGRLDGVPQTTPAKDGINDYVVDGKAGAISRERRGTKCAAHLRTVIAPGKSATLRLRLRPDASADAFAWFDTVMDSRRSEADEFYATLQRDMTDPDARLVQRQAFAGMLWSKQFYMLDVRHWLDGDPAQPPPPESRKHGRNAEWRHLDNADIISMPDTWEYPWYAAWDLAFHCVTFALIDPVFAKRQLLLLMRERYMHPNGQLPAYEWAFGDVNPPVHGWAVLRVFQMDRALTGVADREFLEKCFHKLLLNFTWWVNRKDASGRNIFGGGFLGLDNIAIFDRSRPLPTGGSIDQSDGTAWMAMFTLNLLRIALELALEDAAYEDMATKFFEHFLLIAEAMTMAGGIGLWDDTDEFYYDVLHLPDSEAIPMRVRSVVGLIPLFAVEVIGSRAFQALPEFSERLQYFLSDRPDLAQLISRWNEAGSGERRLLSLLRGHRMKMLLKRMLDENEFLSPYGVRSVSKYHADHPYVLAVDGARFSIGYEPGEGSTHAFGGNSNWRGPVWMPINILLIDSLREFQRYYGDDFVVEYPTGSGTLLPLRQVADELGRRITRLFLRDAAGRRAIFGDDELSQTDPEFRDHMLFHEYFHGDTGRGLGAAHQTGWTGCVALLLSGPDSPWRIVTAQHPQPAAAPPAKVEAT